MIAGTNKKSNFFLILTVIFCFIISGCGGGGGEGGSALTGAINAPGYAPFAFKLQMAGSSSDAPGYFVPSNAAGEIKVTVTSLKDAARKVSKSVSYNAGYMVFENELLSNDTYSVSVIAKIKTASGDTVEVWSGGSPHFKLSSNEELLKNPEINTLNIDLVFSHHETIQIVPSKIFFEPALPISGLTPGALIPSFSVKMTDQYGFAILSAPEPVTISLVNGVLIGETSAQVIDGAAAFSRLSVSNLSSDSAGNVYLKASYGAYSALSQAIKASIIDAPNTTIAGYLDFTFNDKSPALRSPAPGRACSIAVEGRLYETVTDSNGFYKIDVLINASPAIAKLSVIGPSGSWESTEALLSASKLYAANVTFSSPDRGCLAIKDIGAFSGVMPLELLKQQLDSKIAEIRKTSAGALAVSGRVVNKPSSSGGSVSGISGAVVSVTPGGASTQTDAAGFFKLNGPFVEGAYRVEATKTDYSSDGIDIYIGSNDYGFDYGGLAFELVQNVIVKQLVSISISPSSASLLTGQQYALSSINSVAAYSDGTSAPFTPVWSVKSGGGEINGLYFTAPAQAGTVILTASHSEGGIAKTVDFNITVTAPITLSSLILSGYADTIEIGASYELSKIKAFAVYSDRTTKEVSVTWSAESAGGTLVNGIYTAPMAAGRYAIKASYTEADISKEAEFVMNVTDTRPVPSVTARIISENTVRLEFSENIDIGGFDPSKVILNSSPLSSADTLEIKIGVSLSVAFLTLATDFSIEQQRDGIAASAGRGLELTAGCGIKSAASGAEAVTNGAIALIKDETPPPAPDSLTLSKLMFSSGQSFVLALDSITYAEMAQLEFYAGASDPDSSTQPAAAEMIAVKGHAKNDVIFSGFEPISSGNIYYRFKDRVGNISQWGAYGVIPAPLSAENITWSNATRAFKAGGAPLGNEGDKVFVYCKTLSGAVEFKGSSPAAPLGGFAPQTSVVISDTPLDSGVTVMYSIVSPLNVESLIIADGIVPAPPEEITGSLRLGYDIPNYALHNISTTSSVTLLNDLRVIIESNSGDVPSKPVILGRIRKSTTIGSESTPSLGSYINTESKDVNGLHELQASEGGILKFSYVVPAGESEGAGNESIYVTSIPGNIVTGPAPVENLMWDDESMSVKVTGSRFGHEGCMIKVYEITASGEILYIGSSEEASDGGFSPDMSYYVGNKLSVSTSSVAFTVLSDDRNESKMSKKRLD